MIGLGPGIETLQGIIQEIGIEITKVGVQTEDTGLEQIQDRGDRSRSRSSTNMDRSKCYRCNEYDHFARECPSSMLDEEQDAVLQLLAQEEQAETLNYSESNLN